jgi:hypothetical protein
MRQGWSAFQRYAVPGFVGLAMAVAATLAIQALRPSPPTAVNPEAFAADDQRLMTCIAKTVEFIKPPKVGFDLYEKAWRLCGNQIYNSMYFTDFSIRRNKLIQQEFDERVNLWMVVCITISGVLLAGVQLFMSYRIAAAGHGEFAKDMSLVVQQGKISMQSSVTGVIVLAISLAFFMVYVKWIYSISEFQIMRPDNLNPTQVQLLPGGSLTPPPDAAPATPAQP